jgi:hypothetical protein
MDRAQILSSSSQDELNERLHMLERRTSETRHRVGVLEEKVAELEGKGLVAENAVEHRTGNRVLDEDDAGEELWYVDPGILFTDSSGFVVTIVGVTLLVLGAGMAGALICSWQRGMNSVGDL